MYKGKIEKIEGCQTKPVAARPLNSFFVYEGEGHTLKVNKYWQLLSMLKLCYTQ